VASAQWASMSSKVPAYNVNVKRIYDPPAPGDGFRVLVDRLWPRGLSKDAAAFDEWMKDIAPSAELRRWFGHDPTRWDEFQRRYAEELNEHQELTDDLRKRAKCGPITLVYSARDETHNNAVALRDLILGQ
jgi:uncharacterized protein YeaO (DUF488 family)